MRLRILMAACMLAACDPNLTRPPGAQVTCETHADCQGAELCDELTKLCAAPGVAVSPRLNLRAESTGAAILLQWDLPPSDFLGFVIERQSVGTSLFESVGELPWGNPPPQFFLDSDVRLDTQYAYRIRLRASGITLDSHPDDEIVQWAVPNPVTSFGGVSTGPSEVAVSWTDLNANTTSYTVFRRADSETDSIVLISDLAAPASSFADSTAQPDTRYFYAVAAANQGGLSLAPEFEVWTVPAAPVPLALTTESTSSIVLGWMDTSANETTVRVERQTGGGGFVLVSDLSPGTTSFTDTGLTGNTTYDYRVSLLNPGGSSPPAEATERTSANPQLTPSGLSLDSTCQLDAAATATFDSTKGASAGATSGSLGAMGRAANVVADLTGVRGDIQQFDLAAFDVSWQVTDDLGGDSTLVRRVRLTSSALVGAGLDEVPQTATQHPQEGLQHWYADAADEPTPSGGVCEQCGGIRGAVAHGGFGESGVVRQLSLVVTPEGRLLGWGSTGGNGNNQVGRRGTGESFVDPQTFSYVCPPGPPTPCPGEALEGVVSAAVGQKHACALLDTGNVLCWGSGEGGVLGTGDASDQFRPTWVCADDSTSDCASNPLTGVIAIAAGTSHTCALLQTGGVKCWGENNSDALGGGATADSFYPIDVCNSGDAPDCATGSALTGATSITAGLSYTCVTTHVGEAKCWGSGGSLGRGAGGNEPYPLNVCSVGGCGGNLQNVVSLSAGDRHACAVLDSGEIVCWGSGGGGRLGNGTTTTSNLPTPVCDAAAGCSLGSGALTNAIAVSAGTIGGCALLDSGQVRCWGQNNVGQCGDGTNSQRTLPTTVCTSGIVGSDCQPLTGAVGINRSSQKQCAITEDGGLFCWGILYDENDPDPLLKNLNAVPMCASGFVPGCADVTDVAVRTCGAFSVVELP